MIFWNILIKLVAPRDPFPEVVFIEEMQSRDRMYRKGLEGGKDLSGNYKSFANSRAYRRYQTTGFYKKAIESMYDMARLMDGEEKKALYEQARKTKEMMINELDKIGDE